jgi:Rieske Fe-S protein
MSHDNPDGGVTRRVVLAGAGATAVVTLTGCEVYNGNPTARAQPTGPVTVAKVGEVPVGGGVVTSHGVVVTQPTAGDFRGFSSVCSHQGCTVARVENREIVCECHGSRFHIEDGSVAQGPATTKLRDIKVVVSGGDVVRPA